MRFKANSSNEFESFDNTISISREQLLRSLPPPADRYFLRIMSAKVVASQRGAPTLRVETEIIEGEYVGRGVAVYFPLQASSGMLDRVTNFFAALGLMDSEWGASLNADRLVGLVASADLSYESTEQGGREFPRLEDWERMQPDNESAEP